MDYGKFFRRESDEVARDLLGRLLIRNTERGATAGRITQIGAYEEGSEIPSREGMKYAPGRIFLMSHRGSHLLNISTEKKGYPSCVEIRQITFHDKIINGAGKVTTTFGITPDLDGLVLGKELQILGKPVEKSRIKRMKGDSDNCIGYFLIK
jgi:3-methyladenine DNA glycosylase Mpg